MACSNDTVWKVPSKVSLLVKVLVHNHSVTETFNSVKRLIITALNLDVGIYMVLLGGISQFNHEFFLRSVFSPFVSFCNNYLVLFKRPCFVTIGPLPLNKELLCLVY